MKSLRNRSVILPLLGLAILLGGAVPARTEPVAQAERIPVDVRRITLLVRDIDKSLPLYRDALGLKVIYDELIGATTDGTLDAQTVTIHVEDAASPIVAGISGGAFKIADSIPEFATPPQGAHVILSLDPKSFDASKAKHADQPHPIAWTRAVGKGHVCYLALGHGEAAWRNANYQRLILNAIDWTRAAK